VPNGSDRSASAINPKLSAIAISVATVGQNRVSPSEYFSPSAQPTSSKPAPRSASQPLTVFSSSWKASRRTSFRIVLWMFESSLRCSRDMHVTRLRIASRSADLLSQN
jgi:hypothetical protein